MSNKNKAEIMLESVVSSITDFADAAIGHCFALFGVAFWIGVLAIFYKTAASALAAHGG